MFGFVMEHYNWFDIKQEPLGAEFEKVLNENLWELMDMTLKVGDKVIVPQLDTARECTVTQIYLNDNYGVEDPGGFFHLVAGRDITHILPDLELPGLKIGDKVEKVGGDYTFVGIVVAAFKKLSGVERFVVEDDRGVLHVYSQKILRKLE
jgi:hypothetical protein